MDTFERLGLYYITTNKQDSIMGQSDSPELQNMTFLYPPPHFPKTKSIPTPGGLIFIMTESHENFIHSLQISAKSPSLPTLYML